MFTRWIRQPAVLGLSLGATLAAAVAGCGGQPTETGDAVVLPDPTSAFRRKHPRTSRRPEQAPRRRRRRRQARPAAAPTKAEGWGTLKGQILFGGTPQPPRSSRKKARRQRPRSMRRRCADRLRAPGRRRRHQRGQECPGLSAAVPPPSTKMPRKRRRRRPSSSTRSIVSSSPTCWV